MKMQNSLGISRVYQMSSGVNKGNRFKIYSYTYCVYPRRRRRSLIVIPRGRPIKIADTQVLRLACIKYGQGRRRKAKSACALRRGMDAMEKRVMEHRLLWRSALRVRLFAWAFTYDCYEFMLPHIEYCASCVTLQLRIRGREREREKYRFPDRTMPPSLASCRRLTREGNFQGIGRWRFQYGGDWRLYVGNLSDDIGVWLVAVVKCIGFKDYGYTRIVQWILKL